MEEQAAAYIAELRPRIQSIISGTERLFLKFAEAYPAFVREMQRSLEKSSGTLGSLGAGMSPEDAMRSLFDSTRETIAESDRRFREMHERDDALLSSLNGGIETLSGLDSVIARIKDDSIEMELISLNAMTVALKSGSAGKAFSVITDELKRLSMRTIALTELLTEDGQSLLELFKKYRLEVQRLEEKQGSLFDGLDDRLHTRFGSLESAVSELASSLADLVTRSRGVEAPVRTIMETVQIQDLVRQSLDHVVMALDELESVASDDELDDIAFRERLAELAESILSDVRARLDAAQSSFRRESAVVRDIVAEGEKRRRVLLDGSFGTANSGAASRSFSEASEALTSIASQVDAYMKTKTAITTNGTRLASSVEGLENRFRQFAKILNRFRTIDIASRIEVSKQKALSSMKDTVIEMSDLTDRIGADVDEALLATKGFIKETKTAIGAYADNAEHEENLIDATSSHLKEAHERLGVLSSSIREGALNFSLFTNEFVELLESSSRDMEESAEYIAEIDAVTAVLTEFRRSSKLALERSGAAGRYDDLHSDRLKEIINRFTIYAHKRVAAELGGFRVEESTELGEVTFF
jgi:hypothetical protein